MLVRREKGVHSGETCQPFHTLFVTKDDFVTLVKALRDLGAVEVQAGEFRVTFALPAAVEAWDPADLLREDPEEDHEAVAKAKRAAWELAQYGSSG